MNSFGKRVLFDGWKIRKPLHRVFRKKNGLIRNGISSKVKRALQGVEIIDWIEKYDTPGQDYLDYLEATKDLSGRVALLIECSHESEGTEDFAQSINSIRGLDLSITVFPKDDSREAIAQDVSSQLIGLGHTLVRPEDFDATKYDFVVWLESTITVRPHGPRFLIDEISRTKGARMAYADECYADQENYLAEAWFKPRYSPLLAEQCDLLGGMVAMRAEALTGTDAAALPDGTFPNLARSAAVKLSEGAILRVPHICYFYDKARTVRLPPSKEPDVDKADPSEKVSIIIPTRNAWNFLGPCIASILQSDWPRDLLEIIVVDNGSDEPDLLDGVSKLESAGDIKVIRDDSPFNFSRLNNVAVRESSGEILLFLNNDTVVHRPSWLHDIIAIARRPKAGAIGAKLLYEDTTVQHSGVVLGIGGGAGHVFVGIAKDDPGYHGIANASREISAVTGACLAVSRSAFDAAGGFDENLKVAYNDIALCLRLNELGLRNYIVADPLLIHYESKSRGFDTTTSKQILNLREASYVRRQFRDQIFDDPYYSPNLSIDHDYHVANFPRWGSPWIVPTAGAKKHVLVCSSTHKIGYGVPVVVERHVKALLANGFEVTVAGPVSEDDFSYDGATRLDIQTPAGIAEWALQNAVDVIWAHTPPYYSVSRWMGGKIPIIAYDYGEPMARLFPDWVQREKVNYHKDLALASCDRIYAISESVVSEARFEQDGIVPLGNDHLEQWSDDLRAKRDRLRSKLGWGGAKVVLNVCRFTEGERDYKGIDSYLECMRQTKIESISYEDQWRFVLCGRGEKSDVEVLTEDGLEVYPNLPDEELTDMYIAADAYANFSRWEGYNLGIGQALALGLPVVASDNPAHRAFGVDTYRDMDDAARRLIEILANPDPRMPRCWNWDVSEQAIVDITYEVIASRSDADSVPGRADAVPG